VRSTFSGLLHLRIRAANEASVQRFSNISRWKGKVRFFSLAYNSQISLHLFTFPTANLMVVSVAFRQEDSFLITCYSRKSLKDNSRDMAATTPNGKDQDCARQHPTKAMHKEASDSNIGATANLNRGEHTKSECLYI
jgi:hypothetical protein